MRLILRKKAARACNRRRLLQKHYNCMSSHCYTPKSSNLLEVQSRWNATVKQYPGTQRIVWHHTSTTGKYKWGQCFWNRIKGKVGHPPSLLLSFSGAHLAGAKLNLFQNSLTFFIFAGGTVCPFAFLRIFGRFPKGEYCYLTSFKIGEILDREISRLSGNEAIGHTLLK